MHLSDFVLLVIGTLAAIAAGLALVASNYHAARILTWIAALTFGSMGVVWSATSESYPLSTQMIVSAVVGAIAAAGLTWALSEILGKEKAGERAVEVAQKNLQPVQTRGGVGGSGEIFGNNGKIVGGKGGSVGEGGTGRGGDGGSGIIHGDGGLIIGGDGGSVDGTNIWYPPAQSAYIQQVLEAQGQTPDFNVQYPGAGGASGGWLQRQQVAVEIRDEYFRATHQEAKIKSSKIEDVPLAYVNRKLQERGYPWRARIDRKYWYLYFIPDR